MGLVALRSPPVKLQPAQPGRHRSLVLPGRVSWRELLMNSSSGGRAHPRWSLWLVDRCEEGQGWNTAGSWNL